MRAVKHRAWMSLDSLRMFSPEVLLPEQLRPRRATDCPERTLMVAVYVDAVGLIRRQIRGTDQLRAEALAWIAADDWDWPFSFRNLSDILGLDATAVRQALRVPDGAGQALAPCRIVRPIVGYVPQPRLPRSLKDRARKRRQARLRQQARRDGRDAAPLKVASSTPSSPA